VFTIGAVRAWKKLRYHLEWIALQSVARVVPLLPRKVCYYLAQATGGVAAFIDRPGRRVALSNLQAAFGDEFSADRQRKIVRESYQHFARTMIDLFWSPRLTTQNISQYVEIKNLEQWREELKPGRPVIFGCYHYGNFEWMSHVVGFAGMGSSIIAQEFKNPLLDPIFVRLRQRAGHEVVARKGAVLHLYKALRRKGRVAILVDLTIPAQLPTVAINCFGLKTSVTFAHAWLHQVTGAPIINAHCEPLPGGRCRVVFHPKVETAAGASVHEISQACWDQFEPYLRQNPAPWLWMYKHWRYRPSNAKPGAYPFYANVSPEFERRLEESEKGLMPMSSTLTLGATS
jgi:KDO2-lipid IV(A) lauroyltransferase